MADPIIMLIDDEPGVLNAIERDIRTHYGKQYRVIKASSGSEALELVQRLKQRNTPVAMFVSDQRMPGMTGTEFLKEALKYYPDARKVLLTAYADTNAAVESINTIGLDHYLMKPWDNPEENMYPVLDDLLSDWLASVPIPYDGIRVAGVLWSPTCHTVKEFLSRNRVPYQWLDIEKDAQVRLLVESVSNGTYNLPVVFFPDGKVLQNPDALGLAEAIGLRTKATSPFYDLIIIGGGPAGLSAAVYGASEGLHTLVIEQVATGGQAGTSSRIENYLGFPKGITGADLSTRAVAQAERLGAEVLVPHEVVSIQVEGPYRIVRLTDGTELISKAIIIATGVTWRELDVPGIQRLQGAGAYYGATLSEAKEYCGQDVYTVGGANSAGQGAMAFSRYAETVNMLVRAGDLERSMSQYLIDQIATQDNISVLFNTDVAEVHGDNQLEALTLRNNQTNQTWQVPAGALFIFIGAEPRTDMVAGLVECGEHGFIVTGPDLIRNGKRPRGWSLQRDPFLQETSVPGIFAAGDVRYGVVRRVVSAVAQGAIAVSTVHQYLKEV